MQLETGDFVQILPRAAEAQIPPLPAQGAACWRMRLSSCCPQLSLLFSSSAKNIGSHLPTLCELDVCLCVYLFWPEKKPASHSSALWFLKPSEVGQLKPQFRKLKTCPRFTVFYKFLIFWLKSEAAGGLNQNTNSTKWLLHDTTILFYFKGAFGSEPRALNSNCFYALQHFLFLSYSLSYLILPTIHCL